MIQKYVSICINLQRFKNTLSAQFAIDFAKVQEEMSKYFANSEILLICDDANEVANTIGYSIYPNVTVKCVSTGRLSKMRAIENLAWQHAIGDIVYYSREYVHSHEIKRIAERIESGDINVITRHMHATESRVLDSILAIAYRLEKSPSYLNGYLIDRTTLNHVFYNQDQVYDVFAQLYTSKKVEIDTQVIKEYRLDSWIEKLSTLKDVYHFREALNQYSSRAMIVLDTVIAFAMSLFISGLFDTSKLYLIFMLSWLCVRIQTIDLTTKQTSAAAHHKKLTGFTSVNVLPQYESSNKEVTQ